MWLEEIRNDLEKGLRVTVLMRHAERPPLEPGDTTFGAQLPLTEYGFVTARQYGEAFLKGISRQRIGTYAGNTLRTIQTATCIREGFHGTGDEPCLCAPLVPELGSGSPFFGRLDERMALIAEGHYRDRLNDYFRTGRQRGYNPLKEATDKMESALERLSAGDKALVIAVTHDINVAAFLAGRGVVTAFDASSWPHYLDAAVIIHHNTDMKEYGYLRFNDFRS